MSDPVPLINTQRFLNARANAGLSWAKVAAVAHVSIAVVRGIESGYNHETITLGILNRIATALGVSVSALLIQDPQPAEPAPDDTVIEAALLTLRRSVPAADLAHALQWPLPQVNAAIQTLQTRSIGTGQTVIRDSWNKARIVASPVLTTQQHAALHQLAPRERGLTPRTARLLRAFLAGRIDQFWLQTASENDRNSLANLINQQILEIHATPTSSGPPVITLASDYEYLADPDPDRPRRNPTNRTSHDRATELSITLDS